MQKYRVLKPYPKQITNSGRLITLKKGKSVYLKREAQVIRLVKMGFLKPIVEMPMKKSANKNIQESPKLDKSLKIEEVSKNQKEPETEEIKQEKEHKETNSKSRRKSRSEYLNKKK